MSFQYSLFRVLMVNDESSNRREGNFPHDGWKTHHLPSTRETENIEMTYIPAL